MAASGFVVTAPLVIAKNDEGADVYLYRGASVPDGQSDEWVKSHKDSGMIATPKQAEKELAAQPADAPAESSKK